MLLEEEHGAFSVKSTERIVSGKEITPRFHRKERILVHFRKEIIEVLEERADRIPQAEDRFLGLRPAFSTGLADHRVLDLPVHDFFRLHLDILLPAIEADRHVVFVILVRFRVSPGFTFVDVRGDLGNFRANDITFVTHSSPLL